MVLELLFALFEQFYARKNARPLLGFFLGSEYPIHRYEAAREIPIGRELVPEDFPALELHIDEGGPSAEELFETHRMILERKPLIIWGDIPKTDLDWIFSKLPAQGLAVITVVDCPQQAEAIWNRYLAKDSFC